MDELNQLGKRFASVLEDIKQRTKNEREKNQRLDKVHVVGAGGMVTAAYEQLRKAAEYADEHLLLQKAIGRFYKRMFLTQSAEFIGQSADELITELTFAEYLPNDSVAEETIARINQLSAEFHLVYGHIQSSKSVSNRGEVWAIDVLAVEVANLLRDTSTKEAFVQFAFDYFHSTTDFKTMFGGSVPSDIDATLFVAVHKALAKSDQAIIRSAILRQYEQSPANFAEYCNVNAEVNRLLESEVVEKLTRYVDRQGAPLRIVGHMIESGANVAELLPRKSRFMSAFEDQVETEYKTISHRINVGIVKSVIFLILTKVLVGILLEVPYDYAVHGRIIWEPLLINLFFPPVYMVLLRLTLSSPPRANTLRLVNQAEEIFYGNSSRQLGRSTKSNFGMAYNIAYGIFFLAVFALVSWLLMTFFQFEIPHLIVFLIFISGASFLGFRLSRMIRDIESVDSRQSGATVIRDFIYMPFVVVGRWMSEKYAKVNFVSSILDMVIELPLKSVLRMVRQWSAFISNKKDQM